MRSDSDRSFAASSLRRRTSCIYCGKRLSHPQPRALRWRPPTCNRHKGLVDLDPYYEWRA